jgi:hypothetical protein
VWFLQEAHGVISQKTPFFMVTAVKTSNLTKLFYITDVEIDVRLILKRNGVDGINLANGSVDGCC